MEGGSFHSQHTYKIASSGPIVQNTLGKGGEGGGVHLIRPNNEFFEEKIRPLQTAINGLKHEKNQ